MRDKILPKGTYSGFRVEFLNFKTPYLIFRRVKLEASNLVDYVDRSITSLISSVIKYPRKGRGQGPWPKF